MLSVFVVDLLFRINHEDTKEIQRKWLKAGIDDGNSVLGSRSKAHGTVLP